KVVLNGVIVRFIADKDVLLHPDSGRSVQGAGRDAGGVAVELAPKQIAAAGTAEAAFRRGRGLVPDEGVRRLEFKVLRRCVGHGGIVTAGAATLRTMAGNHSSQRTVDDVADATAKASARLL